MVAEKEQIGGGKAIVLLKDYVLRISCTSCLICTLIPQALEESLSFISSAMNSSLFLISPGPESGTGLIELRLGMANKFIRWARLNGSKVSP
jgi:hypothetical protein